MRNSRLTPVFAIVLGLLMTGAGCMTKPAPATTAMETPTPAPTPAPTPTETPTETPTTNANEAPKPSAVKEIKITATNFSFTPAEIRVKEGDRVRLTVTSTDVGHGVAIPAFNVNLTLDGGETGSVEFVASKKGSYPFFCSVFCGSGHGSMRGTLIVE